VSHASPSFEQYARVITDTGRYAVLHAEADALLKELGRFYIVERRETGETVRLVPHTPAAAPLAVTFTDFPKVVLRFGRWYQQSLPVCGCDACDEDPAVLVADLHTQVSALVEGGLWERVRRGLGLSWSESLLVGPDFRASQQWPLTAGEARSARREGFAAATQWAPWPRRRGFARAETG
jgi:Family of unknown function (DUF6226)